MINHPRRLGYGVTAWARGVTDGHLDGIGVYTQALHKALSRRLIQGEAQITPFAFGHHSPELPCGVPDVLASRVSVHLVQAAFFRRRIDCASDLFHATDHYIPLLRHVPVVATVMDLIPFIHPEWVSVGLRPLKNWLFKRSILSADHLITISEHSRRDLMTHFGISSNKISVTPLGVDPCYFSRVPERAREAVLGRYALSSGFFLFIGTLQPRKNLETLLDAHAQLPLPLQKRHPLVVVGRHGWGVLALLPRLRHLEQQGTVRWLDYVPQDDVMALLHSARALTFLSLYEGFGLPVLEAFAAGCPVIASNTTSIPEVAGDAALLVDPRDRVLIAEAMMRLIEDDALVHRLKERGQKRASVFTWDACAAATLLAYQVAMKSKARA